MFSTVLFGCVTESGGVTPPPTAPTLLCLSLGVALRKSGASLSFSPSFWVWLFLTLAVASLTFLVLGCSLSADLQEPGVHGPPVYHAPQDGATAGGAGADGAAERGEPGMMEALQLCPCSVYLLSFAITLSIYTIHTSLSLSLAALCVYLCVHVCVCLPVEH